MHCFALDASTPATAIGRVIVPNHVVVSNLLLTVIFVLTLPLALVGGYRLSLLTGRANEKKRLSGRSLDKLSV